MIASGVEPPCRCIIPELDFPGAGSRSLVLATGERLDSRRGAMAPLSSTGHGISDEPVSVAQPSRSEKTLHD